MNLKKQSTIFFIGLAITNQVFSQVNYPASASRANKNLSSASKSIIKKSYDNDTTYNIRVSEVLMDLYKQKKVPNADKTKNTDDIFSYIVTRGSKIRVQIIASSVNDVAELKKILTSKGLTNIVSYENFINADIDVNEIASLEEITSIMMVKPIYKPSTNSGAVQTQVDRAVRANIARNTFGVNGTGIKIGIISDSYNALGGAAVGVTAGELPGIGNPSGFIKPVVVLKDFTLQQIPILSDEGRGMAEIVHDVAPGAEIYFYSAFGGNADFAAAIRALANAGCKIIVDDVSYFEEPFFQDGILARAVEDVTSQGVSYFSSAGNSDSKSYELNFKPFNFADAGETPVISHNFSSDPAAPSDNLPFFCPIGAIGTLFLQWSQPFKSISGGTGAKTDLDIFVFDLEGNLLASNIENNLGEDPLVSVGFRNTSQNTELRLVVAKKSGINTRKIKIRFEGANQIFNNLINTPGLFASTITGQANARNAITVGAADYRNTKEFGSPTNIIQNFSSRGGTDILFNRFGGNTFDRRLKPEIVAADNGNTSFFGRDRDNDGLPNFNGTSASAPLAAAVAALGLEASNCFQPSPFYVKSAFILNSEDMDDPATVNFDNGFDFKTGYGYINAEGFLHFFDFCNFKNNIKDKKYTVIDKKQTLATFEVSIFPNPVTNVLNITINTKELVQGKNIIVKILDANGKQIITSQNAKGSIISIDVQSLSSGTYVAQINVESMIKNLTFIKQ